MLKQKLKVATHSQETQDSLLLNLPDEVKLHIMSFLGKKSLATASKVCKDLNNLSKDNSLIEVPDYRNPGNPEVIAANILTLRKSVDGRFLGIISGSPFSFSLLNIDTGAVELEMPVTHYSDARNVDFSLTPDNKRLIITWYKDADFDPDTGMMYRQGFSNIDIWDLEKQKKICTYENLSNHEFGNPPCPSISIVSNENFLVSFRGFNILFGDDQRIFLCDINKENNQILDNQTTNNYEAGKYYASCISPDKKLYARSVGNSLDIYNLADGIKIRSILLPKEITGVPFFKIQFLNDNQTICMIGNESFVAQGNNAWQLQKPYLLKVNCLTEQMDKISLKLPEYDISSIATFTLLPNNHIALLDNRWLDTSNEKIYIFDLNTQELIKSISTTSKTLITNNDGSKIYIRNEDNQLTKIDIPIITKQQWLKEESEKMEVDHEAEHVISHRM